MGKRRIYSAFEKMHAKSLASRIGVAAAAKQLGIPESTLRGWGAKGPEKYLRPNTSGEHSASSHPAPPKEKKKISAWMIILFGAFCVLYGIKLLLSFEIGSAFIDIAVGAALIYYGQYRRRAEKAASTAATPAANTPEPEHSEPAEADVVDTSAATELSAIPGTPELETENEHNLRKKKGFTLICWIVCVVLALMAVFSGGFMSTIMLGLGAALACPLLQERMNLQKKVWIPAVAILFVFGCSAVPASEVSEQNSVTPPVSATDSADGQAEQAAELPPAEQEEADIPVEPTVLCYDEDSMLAQEAQELPRDAYAPSETEHEWTGISCYVTGTVVTQDVSKSDVGFSYFVVESEYGTACFVDLLSSDALDENEESVQAQLVETYGPSYSDSFPTEGALVTAYGVYFYFDDELQMPVCYCGLNPEIQTLVLAQINEPETYPKDYHADGMESVVSLSDPSAVEPGTMLLVSGVVVELKTTELEGIPCPQMLLETENGNILIQNTYDYFASENGDQEILDQLDAEGDDYSFPAQGERVQVYVTYSGQSDSDETPVYYYGASQTLVQFVQEQIAQQEAPPEETDSDAAGNGAADSVPVEPVQDEAEEPDEEEIIVYITNTGEKYHRGSCRTLKKSKIETTLSEAIASGYEPCGICHPPTE